ncbi:MAG: hypothetical protein K8R36_01130 [Planctomycetales bacterium]|nr:hypothetical protein [Planctomycetales bacterium]
MHNRRLVFATFLVGLIGGIVLLSPAGREGLSSSSTYAQQKSPLPPDFAALRADVEQLKKVVSDQSHAMTDVCYSCHKAADKP